jgi:hypothetical protein
MPLVAVHDSAYGPNCQFVAAQQWVRYQTRTRRSAGAANTAAKISHARRAPELLGFKPEKLHGSKGGVGPWQDEICGSITISAEIWSRKSRAGN